MRDRRWRSSTIGSSWRGKGTAGDQGIYFSSSADGLSWEPQRNIPGIGTSASPALAEFNGVLFMAWKGIQDDSGIYFSFTSNGVDWVPQQNVGGVGTSTVLRSRPFDRNDGTVTVVRGKEEGGSLFQAGGVT